MEHKLQKTLELNEHSLKIAHTPSEMRQTLKHGDLVEVEDDN